jgi:hypothetical protein
MHHLANMTENKVTKIKAMVASVGKSSSRISSAERVFDTFRLYATAYGVDAASGTDVQLPNLIAEWLGLIAGVGCEEGDQEQLTAVNRDGMNEITLLTRNPNIDIDSGYAKDVVVVIL